MMDLMFALMFDVVMLDFNTIYSGNQRNQKKYDESVSKNTGNSKTQELD